MAHITDIHAIEILDSRGNPTVQATVRLDTGDEAAAAVPSGASKGKHEAVELRDGDQTRYHGQGVQQAIDHIHTTIRSALVGMDVADQAALDHKMIALDGTENKSILGANALLSVSLAACRAAARSQKIPLYRAIAGLSHTALTADHQVTPMMNVLNGGLHAGGNVDFQEFMLIPNRSTRYGDALRMGSELYQTLKSLLKKQQLNTAVGDEGGFAPALSSNHDALDFLRQAVQQSPYQYQQDVAIGLDLASSNFFHDDTYHIKDSPQPLNRAAFIAYLAGIQKEFGLVSLEDPLMEDDWEGWQQITEQLGTIHIVGDDLLVTNPTRLKKAIAQKACNSILVKVNQIGTLTETLDVIAMAKAAQFSVIISHRSGETPDDFIADLAVGVAADFVKFGAPARGERVAKYNRLLEIYGDLQKAS